MLATQTEGGEGPWLILLHWLGGSGRTWSEVSRLVSRRGYRVASIDLPGFGDSAALDGYSVESMASAVTETIQSLRSSDGPKTASEPWLLGGHSMGGKIAAVVAHLAAAGEPCLGGLEGLFLVSPSPPGPEPFKESKREELLRGLGERPSDKTADRTQIHTFVLENVGKLPLPEDLQTRTEEDFLRSRRPAFKYWLDHGSKEDWSDRVGVLPFPTLILAGSEEDALGPEAQRRHTLPHLLSGELFTLQGAGHLAPLERPMEVALRLLEFSKRLGLEPGEANLPANAQFQELLDGPLTSPQTRAVLRARSTRTTGQLTRMTSHQPLSFTAEEFLLLDAFVGCVIPDAPLEIPARLDQMLASGHGDGWRYATLPHDREAWVKGLRSLDHTAMTEHGVPFIALWAEQQRAILAQARDGDLGPGLLGSLGLGEGAGSYTGAEMKQWFGGARGELARLYMSDPRTMQRVGFTGFADEAGFTQIRLGETERFEG